MNYHVHYERLMQRARVRALSGYRERHHIVPRCIGGTQSRVNLVELTPEEHYVAHQILVKIYPGNARIAYAAMAMAWQAIGNRPYGWLRRRYAAAMRGVPKSAEHREKIARAQRGVKRGPLTPEHRAKLSAVQIGKKRPSRPLSPDHLAKLRAGWNEKARTHPPEVRAKISAANRGNSARKGQPHSAETLAKMAEARRSAWAAGKYDASKTKMAEAGRAYWSRLVGQ